MNGKAVRQPCWVGDRIHREHHPRVVLARPWPCRAVSGPRTATRQGRARANRRVHAVVGTSPAGCIIPPAAPARLPSVDKGSRPVQTAQRHQVQTRQSPTGNACTQAAALAEPSRRPSTSAQGRIVSSRHPTHHRQATRCRSCGEGPVGCRRGQSAWRPGQGRPAPCVPEARGVPLRQPPCPGSAQARRTRVWVVSSYQRRLIPTRRSQPGDEFA